MQPAPQPDAAFVEQLRPAVERYFKSVDAWEAEHRKFYRLASPHGVSPDLEQFQKAYLRARRDLESLIPRARQLCRKLELRDAWSGLMHIHLGGQAPQAGTGSAIGRGERSLVEQCLTAMETKTRLATIPAEPPQAPRGLIQRVRELFF